jgi:Asp-tRNA(Asn)/Glu-tRNA(Gln) amidotransferase B subunit
MALLVYFEFSSSLQGVAMPAAAFHSVKLPAELIEQARDSAEVFRRSTAAQIEYWALLGKAVEESGITAREARAVIAPAAHTQNDQVSELLADFTAFDGAGSLARHVREIVAANAANAISNGMRKAA